MKMCCQNVFSASLAKKCCIWVLCSIFVAPVLAEDISPQQLLGMQFPDPNTLPIVTHKLAGGDEEDIAISLDLPPAAEIERMLGARTFTLRGKKEIGINNKVAPATVFIQGSGTCTGSIVSPQGKILTCWHCVRGKDEVYLRLHPAISSDSSPALLRARVERVHPETDLALLQITSPVKGLPVLELGEESDLEVGADVYAVGHPSGLHWTFVKGYISQLHTQFSWNPDRENRHKASVIQSQIPLYEGNSGGPLISDSGRLIGVNATRRDGEQFTFAVALNDIRRFIGNVAEHPASSNAVAKASNSKVCRPARIAERRNTENTATLVFFDSKCSGKADIVRFVFDDDRPSFVAKTSDLTGKIDTVVVQNAKSHEIYLRGKKETIELDGVPANAGRKVEKLEIRRR